MKLEERDLTETEKARISWGVAYLFAIITFLIRAVRIWDKIHAPSFHLWNAIFGGFNLLICLFPLLFGLLFRRVLKKELQKDLLSARTYQMSDYWIAQLLFFSYVAMETYEG
jgi:cellulose synthase/poly-beta-1,6-N-acetylglucosamine synthase-like glycosyltransferase